MKNLKERQKEESRKKILMSALGLFKEKGFHATGVDELMEKAGLTAGAFYAHFKSKQELLEETLKYGLHANRGLLTEGLGDLKGEEFLTAVLSRYVSEAHRDHPKAGCPLPAIASELYRSSDHSSKIIGLYLESWIEIFRPHLEHLRGSESEKRQQALRLLSQAVGAILLSRLTQGNGLSEEILRSSQKVKL